MNVWLVIAGILCHALSGVPGLFTRRRADGGERIAVTLAVLGSVLGIAGAVWCWWRPPEAMGAIRIDGLSVIFMLPIFLVSAMGSLYGLGYWGHAEHPHDGPRTRLFYGLVTAGLVGVTVAAHAILFLVAWEVMALSAFFLVTTEDEHRDVRDAGWVYIVATHTATLCLFALFAFFKHITGSYALAALPEGSVTPAMATGLFLLTVAGFGMKAGVMPLHIWLPGAHAMAPSHVSALMSGVLIKIGIYGMVRMLSLLPVPPVWWGGLLLVLGIVSGVLGVVFALGQHDLKRLLAYHSIENIGIIMMGVGLAVVGRALHRVDWVVLGMGGALLHVWNHGLFKSLLFLSAGAVIHETHTRDMDLLGGLGRSMPRTALCFAVGAVAICGLPPLNGFVSELMIYLGLFHTLGIGGGPSWGGGAFAAPALALIGGLAVACFVKVFGTVFLGQARSDRTLHAHEPGASMMIPMFVLGGGCLGIGLAPLLVIPILDSGILVAAPELAGGLPSLATLVPLGWVSATALTLGGLLLLVWALLAREVRQGGASSGVTWDCGYAAPAPTMQYTSSSFAQMLVGLFAWVLRPHTHRPAEQPLFAGRTRFGSHVPDLVLDGVLRPVYRFGAWAASSLRFFQAGNVQAYLFYIAAFLIVLLLWR
jgi:formate hydrogenlyase subunit 3/multisubunit Na+/H+ antiporter MnhD subunit